jgi:DHA1 family inner membrane transport protein
VYFATFSQATCGLSLAGVVIPLAVFAPGSILGTIPGGQLADRLLTIAIAMFGPLAACIGVLGGTLALVGRR